ncbi:MAG: DUF6036 family nucleotidyltransferase [Candidatus Nitrosotenuis sp.]
MRSKRKKTTLPRIEVHPRIWLPSAYYFGNLFESNKIRYAIFGAGALAIHNVMIRPTVDIDFVVDDYDKAVNLLKEQPNIASSNLQKDKDGIQVADFNFKSGITVQIWDNSLYSLPMNDVSWSHVILGQVPGYGTIRCVSMEDLIVSKIGRHTQRKDSQYEADKNVKDIVATIQTLAKPDFKYIIERLKEGARRESTSNSSKIHRLDWYFAREVQLYLNSAQMMDQSRIGKFIANVLVESRSMQIEYWLLHALRKIGSKAKFQSSFMLDEKNLAVLLKRWESILQVNGDQVTLSSKDIQDYVKTRPEALPEYGKRIAYSAKKS